MSPLPLRLIKSTHQKVKISSKCLHKYNFLRLRTNNRRHHIRRLLVHIDPRRIRVILQRLEMSCYALGGPCCEVLVYALRDAAGLDAQGVAAEVDGLVVGVDVCFVDPWTLLGSEIKGIG